MFSLANGKLIRINSDGSDGEPIQTKNPSLTIGTSMLSDCCVSDTTTDPATHLAYEISKDELGRVIISNKCGAQLLVNGELVSKKRPLLNNSQIEIPNIARFRWIHSHDATEARDSEFASWSDPGKKSKSKSRWASEKGRLTTHALHLLSSAQNDSSFNDSKNNSVHSFVDENDENSRIEETSLTENVLDACNFMSTTPKRPLENPLIPSVNDSMMSNDSFVLGMSQMMLTSYVASEIVKTPQNVHAKRESAAYSPQSQPGTPQTICFTPSSVAFQQIDQNENSPAKSASFAILKSPTTPTPGGRLSKSMYLIDLTTPPIGTSANMAGSKSSHRHLLKSAIKNSTHKLATKIMNPTINTVSVSEHVVTGTPKMQLTPADNKRSNFISSTPVTSAMPKSSSISSDEKGENDNSEEVTATADAENTAGVEASPFVLFSDSNDNRTPSKQTIAESSIVAAMENLIDAAGGSQPSADVQNNSTVEIVDQNVTPIVAANKSHRVSEITNMSVEEEEALLKIDGDAEVNDDEFNEEMLLAGSTDDEDELVGDPAEELTAPNIEPENCQRVEDCDIDPPVIANPNEKPQSASADVVETIYDDLINNLDGSGTCKSATEAENTGANESGCTDTSTNEFSALHASSSSDSDQATEIDGELDASVEPVNDTIVISSQEQSSVVDLDDGDSTFGNASCLVVSHDANDSTEMEGNTPQSAAADEEILDINPVLNDELDSESTPTEPQCNDFRLEANQEVDEMPNDELASVNADGAIENPNASIAHEENVAENKPSEPCDASVITGATTINENVPTTLSEAQFDIEKEDPLDSTDEPMSDMCGITEEVVSESEMKDHHEPASQTDSPTTANTSVIESELIEDSSEAIQSVATKMDALSTSESIEQSVIVEESEVNAILDTLADSESNAQTENEIFHSSGIADPTIETEEMIPESVSLDATEQVAVPDEPAEGHNIDSKKVPDTDESIPENQEEQMAVDDQNIPTTAETDPACSTATHHVQTGDQTEQMSPELVDDQQSNSSVVDYSVGDEQSTNNIQEIVIEDSNGEQTVQLNEETEVAESIESGLKDIVGGSEPERVEEDLPINNKLNAAELSSYEHIHTIEEDTDSIEPSASNEQMQFDQEIVEDEAPNAESHIEDEMRHEPTLASSTDATQETAEEIVDESNVIATDTEMEPVAEDPAAINESNVESSIEQFAVTHDHEHVEDIATEERSQETSTASENGEIKNDLVPDATDDEDVVTKNVDELYPEEQRNVVEGIDVDSKDDTTHSEIENPEKDIDCDSESITEICFGSDSANKSSAVDSTNDRAILNEVDSDSVESAVSISSDDIAADQLPSEHIEETEPANDTDLTRPQQIEVVETPEELEVKSDDDVMSADNVEADSVNITQVTPVDQGSDEISNELAAADEKEQKETVATVDSTVDDAVDKNKENSIQLHIEEAETVESKDIEIVTETDNAELNELISNDWCIVVTEKDVADLSLPSANKDSMETEPIDEIDTHGGATDSSSEQPVTEQVAENPVIEQSANVIAHPDSHADKLDSFQAHAEPSTEIVESKPESEMIAESIDDCDEMEVDAAENESGIVDVSATNTDANDITDEHDGDAKLDTGKQNANTSEGFNSCASRESIEENSGSESEAKTVTGKTEVAESFVTKTDELKRIRSSIGSRKSKILLVTGDDPPIVDVVSDASAARSSIIDRRSYTSPVINKQTIGFGSSKTKKVVVSPISLKRDERAPDAKSEMKSTRRKQLATPNVAVESPSRTPRQRQVPARLLESTYSTPVAKTPRSTKKLQDKFMKNLRNDDLDIVPEVSRDSHIAVDIVASGKKRTSGSNEEKPEKANETNSNEVPKIKRKRVAKVVAAAIPQPEPKPSTSAAAVTNFESKSERSPAKIDVVRSKLNEQIGAVADVKAPKRSRRPAEGSGEAVNAETAKTVEVVKPKSDRHLYVSPAKFTTIDHGNQREEKEKPKRARRQVTSKTINYADQTEEEDAALMKRARRPDPSTIVDLCQEDEKEDSGKPKRGRRAEGSKTPAKASKAPAKMIPTAEVDTIDIKAKGPMAKVIAGAPVTFIAPVIAVAPTVASTNMAPNETVASKPARKRRPAAQKVINLNDIDEDAFEVPLQSISFEKNAEQELPKKSQRKQNISGDEASSERPKELVNEASTKRLNRKDANKVKDQKVEEKTARDAPLQPAGSRKKTAASKPLETAEQEKRKSTEKLNAVIPARTTRRLRSTVDEPRGYVESEIAHPPTKKRALKGAVAPIAADINLPKRKTRKPKHLDSFSTELGETSESDANSEKPDKKGATKSSTETLASQEGEANVRSKRGRAAKNTETPAPDVIAPVSAKAPTEQIEIKALIAEPMEKPKSTIIIRGRNIIPNQIPQFDIVPVIVSRERKPNIIPETIATVPAVESVPKAKAVKETKKKQKESAAIAAPKSSEAAAVQVVPERKPETVVSAEVVPKVKATRGRKKTHEEPVAIDETAAAKIVPEKQRKIATEATDQVKSVTKPKSTRGRKKTQPGLPIIDETKSIETVAATIAPEPQQEIALKPKSKKRVKTKDESSDVTAIKRGKVQVEPVAAKTVENQPKVRSSRQTPQAADGAQDDVTPSTSSAIRGSRSTRAAKK